MVIKILNSIIQLTESIKNKKYLGVVVYIVCRQYHMTEAEEIDSPTSFLDGSA